MMHCHEYFSKGTHRIVIIGNCDAIYNVQGRIYYEANEASASGPHHLGGPHQNFNAISKVDFLLRKKIFKS